MCTVSHCSCTCFTIALVATHAPEINEGMRNLGGGVSLGVDCVKHAPEVAPALRYAMGNALVADDPARAAQLNRQQHYKVADLDGTLYAVNGSMSGGTTRCDLFVVFLSCSRNMFCPCASSSCVRCVPSSRCR